jgi:hypothetical protein
MICEGCGCVFCPDPPDTTRLRRQRFCTRECRRDYGARRRGLEVCWRAQKITYPTAEAAWAVVEEDHARGMIGRYPLTDVYQCRGHWHTTTETRPVIRVVVRGGQRDDTGQLARDLRERWRV